MSPSIFRDISLLHFMSHCLYFSSGGARFQRNRTGWGVTNVKRCVWRPNTLSGCSRSLGFMACPLRCRPSFFFLCFDLICNAHENIKFHGAAAARNCHCALESRFRMLHYRRLGGVASWASHKCLLCHSHWPRGHVLHGDGRLKGQHRL